MKIIKISKQIIEQMLTTGYKFQSCIIEEGIDKNDILINVIYKEYNDEIELWFDKEIPDRQYITIKTIYEDKK